MTATERLCNLFHEIYSRLAARGRVVHGRCPMPLTQCDLADVVGISPVHVNRVLQTLRAEGLLELRARWMEIHNMAALQRLGEAGGEAAAARLAPPLPGTRPMALQPALAN